MEFYINISIDNLYDDFVLELTIGFDSKDIGEQFITYFNSNNKYMNVNINKKYPLVKYYKELNLYQPKANKSIGLEYFELVINKIDNVINEIENKFTHDIYDNYINSFSDDYILVKERNIYHNDHSEKDLFNIEIITINDDEKNIDIIQLYKYYYNKDKIISKNEYNKYLSESFEYEEIINKKIIENNFPIKYFIFCSIIELAMLKIKYKLKIINKFTQKTKYDYANEKLNEWEKILYSDPINFTSNLEIKKYFSQDTLDNLQLEMIKLIEKNIIKPNTICKPYSDELSTIYNKFIHPRYIQYIEECKDL